MIEIPESIVLAKQLNKTVKSKVIKSVTVNQSPHKFAWFHGEPEQYNSLLKGKKIVVAKAFGGKVEIEVEDIRIAFSEGINLRYAENEKGLPKKHQLLIGFTDGTYLVASVQMYGGMLAFKEGAIDNEYYLKAYSAVNPIGDDFSMNYFTKLISKEGMEKLSIKAFLATEQRIPGLGNGVLQDILFNAKIHPRRKVNTLNDDEIHALFDSIKSTLSEMAENGGRDTEKDLFGNPGGYKTKASKFTKSTPCPECGGAIVKKDYLGGSVYYCEGCQEV